MSRRLACCDPYVRTRRWAHSDSCQKVDELGFTRRGQNVHPSEWITYFPEAEQDEVRKALADPWCSQCGVSGLPHLESCPTNPFSEAGQEYAREDL